MVRTRIDTDVAIGNIFWFFTLIIFAFIASNDGFDSPLYVYYFPGSKWFIHILFMLVIMAFYLFAKRKLIVDNIVAALLVKFFIDLFTTYILNDAVENRQYLYIISADISVLAYVISRNIRAKLENIICMYEWFAFILSLQVITTSVVIFSLGIEFDATIFKSFVRIPFAPSNLIVAVISPVIINMLIKDYRNSFDRVISFLHLIVHVVAIVFIRSRGGIALLFIMLNYTILKRIGNIKRQRNRFFAYSTFIIANILLIGYAFSNDVVEMYFSGYLGTDSFNSLSSRRDEVWEYSWNEFLQNPIWGRGLYYDQSVFIGSTGSHNILLETLMGTGLIGFAAHMMAMMILVNKVREGLVLRKRYNIIRSCITIILLLYMNSMFEVCYYDYIHDVLFWSIAGFLIGNLEIRQEKMDKN